MNIYQLKQLVQQEIVDYNLLKHILKKYAHPRKKISDWIKAGDLIRVKKGLYVFGPRVNQGLYSLEVLANLIYGPSAISLQYALYYYGLIPESVHTVTSITNKRNKAFDTPVGVFTYHYLSPEKFSVGVEWLAKKDGINILIASPEKALCDLIMLDEKNMIIQSEKELEEFLLDNLRIDDVMLRKLDNNAIKEIANIYNNDRLDRFVRYYLAWMKKNA